MMQGTLLQSASGNIYVTGQFSRTVDFDREKECSL
jgi:hypothetical protein